MRFGHPALEHALKPLRIEFRKELCFFIVQLKSCFAGIGESLELGSEYFNERKPACGQ
jgi:hypothetical protein